jgi:polygalacturonase
MAITQNTFTGNGSNLGPFSFTFKWLEPTDIKVTVGGVLKTAGTHYNLQSLNYTTKDGGQVLFTAGNAPANNATIRVYRDTDDNALSATFFSGSAIRAQDLNDDFTQNLYVTQEVNNNAVNIDGSNPMVGDLNMGGYKVTNLATPVAGTDAANRSFVEGVFSSEVPVFYRRWSKTAVGGETSLSGNDNSGIALSYVPGSEKVFINGALQIRGVDYLGTTGSTLTGIPVLTAGDIIEVHSSSSYTVGTVPDGSVTNAKVDGGAGIQSTKLAFTQAGTGAVTRTVESKLRDVVSVKDFGAVGDGVVDDTAAIQAAVNAGRTIDFGSSAFTYKIAGTITVASNTTLRLNKATVVQSVDQTPIINASNTSNVNIRDGRFVGKSETSYLNSPSSQAICIKADSAIDLVVTGNRFENFYYSPLAVLLSGNRIEFSNNSIKGPGASVLGANINFRNTTGVTVIGTNLRIINNDIYDTAQGIIIGEGSSEVVVDSNIIHDLINEHGIYADTGIRRLVISNNVIRNTGALGTGLKVQFYDSFGIQPQCIAITGNVISDTGTDGILVDNTTGSPTLKALDVTISGNSVLNAGAYSIDIREAQDCTVTGNTLVTPLQSGIVWDNCNGLLIADNYVRGSGTSGLRDLAQSSNVTVKNNVVVNSALANTAGDEFGIFLNSGATNCVIDGNIISDANANMQYGIYHIPALNSTLSITRNTVLQSTDTALRLGSTTALREYRGNVWNGALAPTFNDPVLPVVASAGTITLPSGADVVSISGTTNITSITTNGYSGRIVTLVFQGSLTVVRGGTLLVSQALGSFAATSNDTLTLCCDGTTWYEISRSVN